MSIEQGCLMKQPEERETVYWVRYCIRHSSGSKWERIIVTVCCDSEVNQPHQCCLKKFDANRFSWRREIVPYRICQDRHYKRTIVTYTEKLWQASISSSNTQYGVIRANLCKITLWCVLSCIRDILWYILYICTVSTNTWWLCSHITIPHNNVSYRCIPNLFITDWRDWCKLTI